MLKIEHLTKKFGTKLAVNNLSLEIEPGQICAFIGHNGAGKTTTLKACCGILSPDEGYILIDGIPLAENPMECKRRIAYIPDNPDLYDFMSGIKYLTFIADVFGIGKEREGRIKELAERLGITDALASPISTYSHGMKQKLAIISALVHSPKLMILDEPFVGLDPKAAVTLKAIMREICDEGGAIFFSTHVLDVAEKLCNKVAIIKEGRVIVSGNMDEIVKDGDSLESIFMEVAVNAERD